MNIIALKRNIWPDYASWFSIAILIPPSPFPPCLYLVFEVGHIHVIRFIRFVEYFLMFRVSGDVWTFVLTISQSKSSNYNVPVQFPLSLLVCSSTGLSLLKVPRLTGDSRML